MKKELNTFVHTDEINVLSYSGSNGVISGCEVIENTTPDMNVIVKAGTYVLDGIIYRITSDQTLSVTAANSGKYKFGLVRINSSGVASIIYGVEEDTDDVNFALNVPDYDPDNYVLLARILIGNVTSITNSVITDMRFIKKRTNTIALKNQNISSNVSVGDVVLFFAGSWYKTNYFTASNNRVNGGIGIYIGNNTVVFSGVANISGLQASRFYYLQEDGSIGTTETYVKVGYAISSNELLVDIDIEGSYTQYIGFGYWSGGNNGGLWGTNYNTIDKNSFSIDGNAIDVGDLTVERYYLAGANSSSYGYWAGGLVANSTIDKNSFSTDGNAVDVGDLISGKGSSGGANSSTYAYWAGGNNGGSYNVIDKNSFSTDGDAVDVGNLTVSRGGLAGANSSSYGYWGGGKPYNPCYNIIDKNSFSTDGDAVDVGDLTVARCYLAGANTL